MAKCEKCGGNDTILLLQYWKCNKCDPPRDLDGNLLAGGLTHEWQAGYRVLKPKTAIRPFDIILEHDSMFSVQVTTNILKGSRAENFKTVLRPLFAGSMEDRIRTYSSIKRALKDTTDMYTLLTYTSLELKKLGKMLVRYPRNGPYRIKQNAFRIKPGLYNGSTILLLDCKKDASTKTESSSSFKDIIGFKE
jgi:hypothetical protein